MTSNNKDKKDVSEAFYIGWKWGWKAGSKDSKLLEEIGKDLIEKNDKLQECLNESQRDIDKYVKEIYELKQQLAKLRRLNRLNKK